MKNPTIHQCVFTLKSVFLGASNPPFVGSTPVLLVNIQLLLVETRIYQWNPMFWGYVCSPDRKTLVNIHAAKAPSSCNPSPLHTTGLPTISKHRVTRSLTPRSAPERLNMPQPWMMWTRKIMENRCAKLCGPNGTQCLSNTHSFLCFHNFPNMSMNFPWMFHVFPHISMYFHEFPYSPYVTHHICRS